MTNRNKQKKSGDKAPAETATEAQFDPNERRRVLSSIILDRLQKQDVVWVRIADPDVKQVDDLQIATKARVDAYLIKWSEWPDTLTFDELTSDDGEQAGWMKLLADGWRRLKKQYRLPVTVHLLTNDQPSAKKIAGTAKSDCHLAKFLAQEWKRNQQENEDWSHVWEKLRTASGLNEKQFEEFVSNCRFDCSYARPELDEDSDDYQPYYWVEHIYETLFEHEDHSTLPIELNHAELLQLLGWRREQSRQLMKLPTGAVLPAQEEAEEQQEAEEETAPAAVNEETAEVESEKVSEQEVPIAEAPASLSSLRSAAAAGWLQAASESESETAEWLRAGTEPREQVADWLKSEAEAGTTDSGGQSISYDEGPKSPTSFIGRKQPREKQSTSWKDLAEKEKGSSGIRKFSEPYEAKAASADAQRTSGKLRQMMSSIEPERDDDQAEHEDEEGDDPQLLTGDLPATKKENDPQLETIDLPSDKPEEGYSLADLDAIKAPAAEPAEIEEQAQCEPQEEKYSLADLDAIEIRESSAADAENQDLTQDFSPDSESHLTMSSRFAITDGDIHEQEQEGLDPADTFTRISRLANKQEGRKTGDFKANLDAFNWYLNNGNELFEESRFEDAEAEYVRALELIGTLEGPNHEQEFLILQNLGDIYLFLDKAEQAVALYERTKQARFVSKIPASKYIAALIKLGALHEENNCFNDAEKQYRKAVEVAAEHLPKDDPILKRLNEACLDLARNRSTLMSRFSSTEVERIREMAKQEQEVAIMYRKKKTTESEITQSHIWKGGIRPESDEEEPPPPPSSKTRLILASAAVFVVFVFAYALLVPNSGSPVATTGSDEGMGAFTSTDKKKVITLESGGRANYSYEGISKDASYSFVGDAFQDLIPLIPGHLRSSFTFFAAKPDAIVDTDGSYFYSDTAPELQLVRRMWKYGELAQGYRHEKHFYPESDDAWTIAKDKLTFNNPITQKEDQAVIYATTGESTDTPVRQAIAAGQLWKDQPEGRPGRIICNVYNGRMFFIRAYDRDGKLLSSSEKGKTFYIECSDGLDVTQAKLKEDEQKAEASEETKSNKKLRFVFAATPDVEPRFELVLRGVPGVLFCLVVAAFGMWRYRVNKKNAGPISIGLCVLTTALLLGWYVIGLLD